MVFLPNLANTVAEVGKAKPYGSGWEGSTGRPSCVGRPVCAAAAAAASAGPAQAGPYTRPGAELRPPPLGPPLPLRAIWASPQREARGPAALHALARSRRPPAAQGSDWPRATREPAGTVAGRTLLAGFSALREAARRDRGGRAAGKGRTARPAGGAAGRGERQGRGRAALLRTSCLASRGEGGCQRSSCKAPAQAWGWGNILFFVLLTKIIFNIGI